MVWKLTSESHLDNAYENRIRPFWREQVKTGYFTGAHRTRLHYAWCLPEDSRQVVVISSGRIESLLKYKELIYDLVQNGLGVFILDHRGQGLSDRMTRDPHQGFVADFDDYVADLLSFVRQQVLSRTQLPLALLCHSMGGAIGALALLKEPDYFARAVLCSPMFGIRPAMPEWLASGVIRSGLMLNRLRRRQAGYFIGQRAYRPLPFGLNKLTHSENRYRVFRELYERHPEIQLGGVTSEWLHEAHRAMGCIERQAGQIHTPMLILSAGGDKVVDNQRQRRVAESFANGRLRIIEGARHELLIESDSYRNQALSLTLDFLFDH